MHIITATVLLTSIAILCATVLLVIRPADTGAIVTLIGLATPTIAALLAFLKSNEAAMKATQIDSKVSATHDLVNSQQAQILLIAKQVAHEEGRIAGITEQKLAQAEKQ